MTIGIICYASVGGSGIIATELGKLLAGRGHRVHVFSAEPPVRLPDYQAGLSFHRVETPAYPLFREPQYLLSLANKVVEVASHQPLDILHAHYAIPHATAAYLARQVLLANPSAHAPKVITTLHGTDITLLGADPSYRDIVAFSIQQSDGVTTVSESLKADTRANLGITGPIDVIPNFVDCQFYRRREVPGLRARLGLEGRPVLIHVSNFRPVKRAGVAVQVFAEVRRHLDATLGEANVLTREPVMGAEDFAEYGLTKEKVPLCMFWLGTQPPDVVAEAKKKGITLPSLHSPYFKPIPEPSIETGVKAMTSAVIGLMAK